MKRETMEWLRAAVSGRMSVRAEEAAEDLLAELKRLRRIERAAKALMLTSDSRVPCAELSTDSIFRVYALKGLAAALKKGGRK